MTTNRKPQDIFDVFPEAVANGPGLDGYMYETDVYCVDCAEAIIDEINVEELTSDDLRDMELVPQPIFFGESDQAMYCAECGDYLYGTRNRFFLIEVRDSDGNDCTVYDAIVEAADRDKAYSLLDSYFRKVYPNDDEDGGFGTWHACDCDCGHTDPDGGVCDTCANDGWECSHGGLLFAEEVEEFDSFKEAYESHAKYHALLDLTDGRHYSD